MINKYKIISINVNLHIYYNKLISAHDLQCFIFWTGFIQSPDPSNCITN